MGSAAVKVCESEGIKLGPRDHPQVMTPVGSCHWGPTHLVCIDGLECRFTGRMQQLLRPHNELRVVITGNPLLHAFIIALR